MRPVERLRRATEVDAAGDSFPVVYVAVEVGAYQRYELARRAFRRVQVDHAANSFDLRRQKLALLDLHFALFYAGHDLTGADTVEVLHPLGEAAFRGLN